MIDIIRVEFIPPKKWTHRARWKLLEDYTSSNGRVNVDAEFITDGASIPRIFQFWFSPTGKYFGAAIIHDFILCQSRDWTIANHEFECELNALGIGPIRKTIILKSVHVWGWISSTLNLKARCSNEIT